jgi:hypothetical protein
MKKITHVSLKVALSLIALMPVLGVLGVFPEPTRDLYGSDMAFAFIQALTQAKYVMFMVALIDIVAIIALWTKREVLAAVLLAPITANIIGFHAFLDGGLFAPGALVGDVMLIANAYLLWIYRESYASFLSPRREQA